MVGRLYSTLTQKEKVHRAIILIISGLLVGFCYVAGKNLDELDSLDLLDKGFYLRWLCGSVVSMIVIALFEKILDLFSNKVDGNTEKHISRWIDIGCVVGLLLCWMFALLSIFPGVFSYDAYDEWKQVYTGNLTTHHPVIHVLLLGGLTELGNILFENYNVGIAIYSILQMLIMAWTVNGILRFMRKHGVSKHFQIFTFCFFAVSPVSQLYSICATKDVLFTCAELFFFMYLVEIVSVKDFFSKRKNVICFAVSVFFTMTLRNNGLYIVLLVFVFLGIAYTPMLLQFKKNVFCFLLIVIIPYCIYVGPVYSILNVTKGGIEEMLSVPLQQMARVYCYEADSVSEADLQKLFCYVPEDTLREYRATVADFIKKDFQREYFEVHKADFFKLWIKLGLEHPLVYINSFLINTVDGWYPNADIDGYRHGDGRGSWFDYRVAEPGTEVVYLQGLHEFYEGLSHDINEQSKPLAFLLLSPGWYLVLTIVMLCYFWSRRYYRFLLPMLIFVFHFLTILFGPMMLVRYMLIFYFGFPIILAMAIWNRKFQHEI